MSEKGNYTNFTYTAYTLHKFNCLIEVTWKDKCQPQKQGKVRGRQPPFPPQFVQALGGGGGGRRIPPNGDFFSLF
jgi:hypothetical protein